VKLDFIPVYANIIYRACPAHGGAVVPYLLFCTDEVIPPRKMPDHCRVVPVNSDSIGAALKEACRLMSDGVIVWKLQGADGFRMERSDIEIECLRRQGSN